MVRVTIPLANREAGSGTDIIYMTRATRDYLWITTEEVARRVLDMEKARAPMAIIADYAEENGLDPDVVEHLKQCLNRRCAFFDLLVMALGK